MFVNRVHLFVYREIIFVVDNIIKSSYLRPDVFALVIEFFRDMTKVRWQVLNIRI